MKVMGYQALISSDIIQFYISDNFLKQMMNFLLKCMVLKIFFVNNLYFFSANCG